MRLDLHGHLEPPLYTQMVARVLGPAPVPPWTAEEQLEMMARYGIAATVVSLPPPGVFLGDGAQARELARATNEFYASLLRRYPHRYAALAALPLPDVGAALEELAYALDDLGLDGVALFSQVGGRYLGDERFEPLLAELDRRGAYAFVHPTLPPYPNPLPHLPIWLQEFPFETTRAIAHLLYTGAFHRYPRIRFQFAHLGGAAPFLAHRLASLVARAPALGLQERVPQGPLAYLQRLYYDTGLSNHAPALAAALEVTPVEQIVFGTDWPYAALPEGPDPAPGLGYLGPHRARVEGANARALVPRLFEVNP
ncbi:MULTISPECIES: amidohydrolase family protein [unclassified Meiothermus]|uniref:amidohydrolase family protein n=1 Tax=unclassified Meiothermus TaxID=370471 RepID=UPI000D7CB9AF|nr:MULTISPECIES: amidohydrolase family protein [unclassified Meiothermus]PZA07699.1 amidohydrolase [Meiothermus sp. Pnk-1]RYM34488.1 amidohydrolase [Meiothermus sp. PNK-Is4]